MVKTTEKSKGREGKLNFDRACYCQTPKPFFFCCGVFLLLGERNSSVAAVIIFSKGF
jgi:hypothetical protein